MSFILLENIMPQNEKFSLVVDYLKEKPLTNIQKGIQSIATVFFPTDQIL